MGKVYLNRTGYEELLNEIDIIKTKIKSNSKDIVEYQSDDAYGDGWHDNFAYEQAIKKENYLYHELEQKTKILNQVEIIEEIEKIEKRVGIGCYVTIIFDDKNEAEKYYVSGNLSSNFEYEIPSITLNSPLVRSIYGKTENEKFSFKIDDKDISGKIISIQKTDD